MQAEKMDKDTSFEEVTRIIIHRPVYDQEEFDELYRKEEKPLEPLCNRAMSYANENLECSKSCALNQFLSFFPFINILRHYRWRKDLFTEIVAGLSVGVIHIPQSMGFAIITAVPPVYGLYSSLFPILLYFIFGTSRHISIGTMAIISIMIGAIVERESDNYTPKLGANATQTEIDDSNIDFNVDIAASVTFLVGLIQFGMSVFRLGGLATFMSFSFVGGFMTGAAFHIVTSQVPFMLGIQIPRQVGISRFAKTWYWIFKTLPETNVAELLISITCVTFLIVTKDIINERYKHKLKLPIPAELITVIVGTLVSYLGNLSSRYNVKIVEDIPLGLPAPKIPSLHNSSTYLVDCFAIAVVSYAVSMSLAKAMSHKHRYDINQNQELLAHGMVHGISACFSSFAGAAAPPRTLVHDNAGGKTQVASLASAILILLVCLVIGPLFEPLPNSVLGSICSIALFPLFKQFLDLPRYWRLNRNDFFVWVITFISVLVLDVDYGLYVGVGISLLTLIFETHRGKGTVLIETENTELFMSEKEYKNKNQLHQNFPVAIFKFESPLYFANVDNFKRKLFHCTINPTSIDSKLTSGASESDDSSSYTVSHISDLDKLAVSSSSNKLHKICNGATTDHSSTNQTMKESISEQKLCCANLPSYAISCIIIDCSAISYIDIMGLNVLKQLVNDYKQIKVELLFSNCSPEFKRKMKLNGMNIGTNCFPSTQDAIMRMTSQKTVPLCYKF